MCGIWDALRLKQSSSQETRPLLPPNRAVPSSSRISSNQGTRPLLPPNRTGPKTAPLNKTAMSSPAYTIIRSSPMEDLSPLQLAAVEPKIFQSLFDVITEHLRRVQAMYDRGERAAALRLLRRAVSAFSRASNLRLAKIVMFKSLFKRITNEWLPCVQALFDKGERGHAIAMLTRARSALDEAIRNYGSSNYPVSWPGLTPGSEVRCASKTGLTAETSSIIPTMEPGS